jgi:hypothetical protein
VHINEALSPKKGGLLFCARVITVPLQAGACFILSYRYPAILLLELRIWVCCTICATHYITFCPSDFIWTVDSSVDVLTRLGAWRSGLESWQGQQIFLFHTTSIPVLGPTSLIFSGYRGSFLAVKRSRREFDHSSPSGTEVKNEWRCNCSLPIYFHGLDKDNFSFE